MLKHRHQQMACREYGKVPANNHLHLNYREQLERKHRFQVNQPAQSDWKCSRLYVDFPQYIWDPQEL